MTKKQDAGELAEKEVCELVPCPNCGGKLFQLAKNNPLYDVSCNKCVFRAQVKASSKKYLKIVRGAGWSVMDKSLKAGIIIPPLIVSMKNEIRFLSLYSKNCSNKASC